MSTPGTAMVKKAPGGSDLTKTDFATLANEIANMDKTEKMKEIKEISEQTSSILTSSELTSSQTDQF